MVLQIKPFDFTVPERYSDRDGKQMQMLLLSRNAHEFRKLSWPALNMSPNLTAQKSLENANFSQTVTRQNPYSFLYMVQGVGFEPTNAYAIGS